MMGVPLIAWRWTVGTALGTYMTRDPVKSGIVSALGVAWATPTGLTLTKRVAASVSLPITAAYVAANPEEFGEFVQEDYQPFIQKHIVPDLSIVPTPYRVGYEALVLLEKGRRALPDLAEKFFRAGKYNL
tara:strand:+ start:831 stop:1220 length:390 start_codon:yes stop_codon:yes gene_type:complete